MEKRDEFAGVGLLSATSVSYMPSLGRVKLHRLLELRTFSRTGSHNRVLAKNCFEQDSILWSTGKCSAWKLSEDRASCALVSLHRVDYYLGCTARLTWRVQRRFWGVSLVMDTLNSGLQVFMYYKNPMNIVSTRTYQNDCHFLTSTTIQNTLWILVSISQQCKDCSPVCYSYNMHRVNWNGWEAQKNKSMTVKEQQKMDILLVLLYYSIYILYW